MSSSDVGVKSDITVSRYAGESEIDVIMALIDEELSEPYTVFTYRYFLNQWPELCFLAYLKGSNVEGSGEPQPGRAVGVVICKLERHLKGNRLMRGYIGMLSVQPGHRGKGIATRLLNVALAQLVSYGAQEIVLETEIDNVASLRLYENLGFLREKRLFNFYLNGKDCFRLVLEIPREYWQSNEKDSTSPSIDTSWATSGRPAPARPMYTTDDIM